MGKLMVSGNGYWDELYLVGGMPTYPSEKWWSEFVSWDDAIPNWMEK